ncbi:MAG: flagellar M-ring protein FliF [Glaciihabitans sp.]|nr:flagellar M-ring protein FliF [Glaciihabitans sp.]
MPASLKTVLGRFSSTIGGFSTAQRTIALIGIAVLVLGVVALTSWASKPAYTPLFSGLSASDASTIVEQLRAENVPYELTNGGATILVPEENVYEERLTAAAAGMPSSSTGGYSLLDTMGVTSSEFQQSVTYKRAIEGELARTITAMKGITMASVQLAIPEETVFAASKLEPTASVFVQTDSGVSLGTDQVNAIVHLTSAAIEGMTATGVAVIDANGTVLSAVGVGTTGSADSQATDHEERVRGTVQAMLDRIVGPGNSTVAVAATVSNESAEVVSETFGDTVDTPALTETTETETFTGSGGAAAGVLGADNIAVPGGTDGTGEFSSESSTRNNAINKVTENRTIPAGAIAVQTISVAINEAAVTGLNALEVENLVSAAAGVQVDRGDTVAVRMMDFTTSAADDAAAAIAAATEAANADRWSEILRTGIIALAVVIPLLLLITLFLRRSSQTRETVEVDDLNATAVMPLIPGTSMFSTPVPPTPFPVSPAQPATPIAPLTPSTSDLRNAEITNFAAQDPKRTADYLRRLMDERSSV